MSLVAIAVTACLGAVAYASAGTKPSQLHVVQVQVPGSSYIEGSYSYVRVEGLSGRKVLQRRLPQSNPPAITVTLNAGRYRLLSWQRACDGNCGYLDPPSDRCARRFKLRPQQRLRATIRLSPGSGCKISFTSS